MQNDAACEWVGNEIEGHIIKTTSSILRGYCDGTMTDYESEVEGAAALVFVCTSSTTTKKYNVLSFHYQASTLGLFDLAIKAVDKLIEDGWWREWKKPKEKLAALEELRQDLRTARDEENK